MFAVNVGSEMIWFIAIWSGMLALYGLYGLYKATTKDEAVGAALVLIIVLPPLIAAIIHLAL